MRRLIALFAAALVIAAPAFAQTSGDTETKAKEAPAKRKTDIDTLVGKTLRHFGSTGALEVAKGPKGKGLTVVKLVLSGEVISDPTQNCEITIVSESPIETTLYKDPSRAAQFTADVPACPIVLMPLNDAVLVPPQAPCIFKAADCQANPGGLWGPSADELADRTSQIAKDREIVDKSIAASLKTLGKQDKDAAEKNEKAQAGFEHGRDEMCDKYADEATQGFCSSRVDEARSITLRKRVEAMKRAGEGKNP